MPFGRLMEGFPVAPPVEVTEPIVHFEEPARVHVHDFLRLARTIAPPTDVYDCACGERRRYLRDALGPQALLPEPQGNAVARALDWTWIERRGNRSLALREGRPY